jgi:GNAT superfamily N-acetyltransferase
MTFHIRRLSQDDSIEALTELVHRAYARLGAMGLNYTAVDQSAEITKQRAERGICFVALQNDQLIGTITVQPTDPESECEYFTRPRVASARQFAVDPRLQGAGLGSTLLTQAENWASENGYSEIAVDTAEPAQHLVELYSRRGYLQVGWVQWPGKTYRSVVLSKAIHAPA